MGYCPDFFTPADFHYGVKFLHGLILFLVADAPLFSRRVRGRLKIMIGGVLFRGSDNFKYIAEFLGGNKKFGLQEVRKFN